jgi:hypothetical protein
MRNAYRSFVREPESKRLGIGEDDIIVDLKEIRCGMGLSSSGSVPSSCEYCTGCLFPQMQEQFFVNSSR